MEQANIAVEPTEPIRPCRHMRTWVSALADGSLTGLARWYTEIHVRGCPHCKPAVAAIQALRERLQALADLPTLGPVEKLAPERAAAVDSALDMIDSTIS